MTGQSGASPAAQGVWGLSDVTVPPNPAVSHLFPWVISSALSSGHGILLLPITGFSGITRTKPQITVMTTMDQIQMLVPGEAVTAGDLPSLSAAARRVPGLRAALATMSPALFGWGVWGVWGSLGTDIPVKYWFYWVGVSMPGSLCR